jgi:ribosomal protein L29
LRDKDAQEMQEKLDQLELTLAKLKEEADLIAE